MSSRTKGKDRDKRKIMLFTEWCAGSDPQASAVVVPKDIWIGLMEELDARGRSLRSSITWYRRNAANRGALTSKERELRELFELMEKISLEIEEI